ncbi:hypothetical protein TNCV_1977911 [Trichonephila clavipes]|nr:hypothetical protein TNCV_1977911 [Trichonephila clavipes]
MTFDPEVHEQMFRSVGQSDTKPKVFFPSKLGTHLPTTEVKFCLKGSHFTSVEEVLTKTENLPKGLRSRTVTSNGSIECRCT